MPLSPRFGSRRGGGPVLRHDLDGLVDCRDSAQSGCWGTFISPPAGGAGSGRQEDESVRRVFLAEGVGSRGGLE